MTPAPVCPKCIGPNCQILRCRCECHAPPAPVCSQCYSSTGCNCLKNAVAVSIPRVAERMSDEEFDRLFRCRELTPEGVDAISMEARRAREENAAKDAEIERLRGALEKLECWNQMESGKNCTILASERKEWSKCQVCIAREALEGKP